MANYLVVANQTLGGEQLIAKLEELGGEAPPTLHLLVPVTDTEGLQRWDYPPIDRVLPDAHKIARALAEAGWNMNWPGSAGPGYQRPGRSLTPTRSITSGTH